MTRLEELWSKVQAAFTEALGLSEESPDRAISGWDIMDQVFAQMHDSDEEVLKYAWPIDLYLDGGQLYMVITSEGKLYRAKIDVDESTDTVILGEWEQIITDFVPVESRVRVHRQADGRYRLVAIANTAILNRVGEIDSMAMFDSFIRRAEESGEYPFVTFYHITHPDLLPTFRMGQCDYLARDGEVYIASALIDEDTPLGPLMIRALDEDAEPWGISIGFNALSDPQLVEIGGVKIPVYEDGEHIELSLILEEDAAALLTAIREEVIRMDDRIVQALKKLGMSEETVDEFGELVDSARQRIRAEGLITRTEVDPLEDDPPAEPPEKISDGEEPPEELAPPVDVVLIDEESLPALAESLLGSEPFQEVFTPIVEGLEDVGGKLDQVVAQLTAGFEEVLEPVRERLDALERTDEEKRKEWEDDLPSKRTQVVSYRPRDKGGGDGETNPESYKEIAEKTLESVP